MHRLSENIQSEERLRLALEAAEMGYWEWHPPTNQVIWSSQTAAIFGITPEQFRESFEAFMEMVHHEDREALQQEINIAIKQRMDYRPEYRIIRPDGEVRWLSSHGRAFYDEAGNAVIMLGVIRDITERRQIEADRTRLIAEAQMAREAAETANRAKDEFITQITHDLRSPLNAILGWTKVLRTRSVNQQVTAEALSTIEQSAEKQKHMIEDLLDVSRIVTGKLRLDVKPVSLGEVIRSAMEVMRPACEAKELDCETELATDADAITGDPARLEQVIWNIVSNAVKFTPPRGRVKIRLERADPHVQITISDSGQGIQPDHLPHIFNRYWQPAGSDRRRASGLGLGLSLTRHIIELHGGTVRAESEGEGKGTKFVINLPYRAVRLENSGKLFNLPSEPLAGDPVANSQNLHQMSSTLQEILVIVVDDEQDARELVAAILRQHGADVIPAASVDEALQIINESVRLPDLLVSDVSMPEQDGYSLIRKIRALPPDKGGQIPAIALTAYGRLEDRIEVLSAGFQMHVPKPVEPAELTLIAANLTGREMQFLDF
jgi:PAS domain S-box-containing protein